MQGHYAIRNVMDEANRMGITANDVTLTYLPLFHVFGLYEAAPMAPITGSRQVLMTTFDPGEALRLIEAERVTLVHGFDTHFNELLEHPSNTRFARSQQPATPFTTNCAVHDELLRHAAVPLSTLRVIFG
jgi:acyl-CoA synthetase (AMP-forming)/AMP-acid ligase II